MNWRIFLTMLTIALVLIPLTCALAGVDVPWVWLAVFGLLSGWALGADNAESIA